MEGSPSSFLVAVWVTGIVGGVLGLLGGGFYLGTRIDRARAKGRREAAEALDMTYDRKSQNLPRALFNCGLF